MTIGELKKSLNRWSGDMDECSVIIIGAEEDGREVKDLLGFTAYITLPGFEDPVLVLGSHFVAIKMMKEGRLHYPDGSKPSEQSYNVNPKQVE